MKKNLAKLTCALLLAGTISGCGIGQPDPLLYDVDGNPRESVSWREVDEAGVPVGCSDLEELQPSDAVVSVPIADAEGEPMLIGIAGLALCVDTDDEGGDEGDEGDVLPEVDIEDDVGLDDDSPATVSDGTDGGRSMVDASLAGLRPNGHTVDQQPIILHDPTPEPATD
jgi:hypothetical protein